MESHLGQGRDQEEKKTLLLHQTVFHFEQDSISKDFTVILGNRKVGNGSVREKYHQGRPIDRGPAWADAMIVELRESVRMVVVPMLALCMGLHTRLTTLENNCALTKRGQERTSMTKHVSQLYQSLSTSPIQLRTLLKWVNIMEEQLEHVCDALDKISTSKLVVVIETSL
ncbi:hypothetical protein CJ030_MR8G007638 [Morella rubra]|uniref:Uncharacterized protein n=1 Tax=Morella rubra TaxID=262757 RepID=A0A6A1UNF8_9ROSI|nr:hypothetical protein CJ030_MR8G007638 [Morella rubra]